MNAPVKMSSMTSDELRRYRAVIERIAESHGARNVRVVGPVAWVTRCGSHVDFLD